jgi:thiol-disulfide isomerase/thioredoxin
MPKPPILPVMDWQALFERGRPYAEWIQTGESESNRRTMESLREKQTLNAESLKDIQGVDRPIHIIAIAEDWCPDVVRHVPVLMKIAEANENLRVRFISREDSPDAFVRYLTLGGEAVPKFIFLSDRFVECGSWGPMPDDCRKFIARGKACGDVKAARQKVFQRYQADPECRDVERELLQRIEIAACREP